MTNWKLAMDAGLGYYLFFFALLLIVATVAYAANAGLIKLPGRSTQSESKTTAAFMHAIKKAAGIKGFEVMGKTTVAFGGQQFTFDAILLGYYGTIAVKANYESGEIYGSHKDESWCAVSAEGKKTYFENPLDSLMGCTRLFKDLYTEERVKFGMSDSFVVFADKKAKVFTGKKLEVYTLDKLGEKLTSEKYTRDNGADINAMKAALEKYAVK